MNLGRLYVEDLYLSSCWRILAPNLAVFVRIDLVADMVTDAKREMIPNNFGMTYPLFYFS